MSARGNAQQAVFVDARDRETFFEVLAAVIKWSRESALLYSLGTRPR